MKIGKNFILFNNDEMPEYGTVCKKEFESIVRELQDKDREIRELKEVKSENMKLKMEKIGKKIQDEDIKINEDLVKAGLLSLKSCLNSMDSLSDKGEK